MRAHLHSVDAKVTPSHRKQTIGQQTLNDRVPSPGHGFTFGHRYAVLSYAKLYTRSQLAKA